tara:strand:- start:385 stop:591 length:207 start_codon:yes stop_codon:yes gene_type:complete
MSVSFKNKPVVDRLILILAQAKNTAAAIADNAIDDQDPIDDESIMMLSRDLNAIKQYLHTAYELNYTD